MYRFDEMYNHFLREVIDLSTEAGQAKSEQKREKSNQERDKKKTERENKKAEKDREKEKDEKEEEESGESGGDTKNLDLSKVDSIQIKLKK